MTDLRSPVSRYASRLHAVLGDRHHVASPLGAWLLLALSGPAATDRSRAELASVLGMEVQAAADAARTLLERPHPLVGAASAAWHGPGHDVGQLDPWRATLPRSTAIGPLPPQAELDAWARQHSLGLIEQFPIQIGPDVVLLLASALASRISWDDAFQVDTAIALGTGSPWAGRVHRVLRTPQSGHHCWIGATPGVGEVIVHAAPARPADGGAGLLVVSVAARPEVPAVDVLAAAHDIAVRAVDAPDGHRPGSLYELPLGDTPLWSLREETVHTDAPDGRDEQVEAVLPAWAAEDTHDLTAPELGFPAAAQGFAEVLGRPLEIEATQATAARFGRHGFEAAAVTAFALITSLPPEGVRRVAELRFGHPYAVVAVATDHRSDGPAGPWHGVPVFSAWVAEPAELTEADLVEPPTEW